jgi:hypothetical protein
MYSRGQIEILDRGTLERLCCECYGYRSGYTIFNITCFPV